MGKECQKQAVAHKKSRTSTAHDRINTLYEKDFFKTIWFSLMDCIFEYGRRMRKYMKSIVIDVYRSYLKEKEVCYPLVEDCRKQIKGEQFVDLLFAKLYEKKGMKYKELNDKIKTNKASYLKRQKDKKEAQLSKISERKKTHETKLVTHQDKIKKSLTC